MIPLTLPTYLTLLISLPYTTPVTLSLPPTTNTTTTTSNEIHCFTPHHPRLPTSIAGCRPTLNWIRTLPSYRKIQDFQTGRSPIIQFPGNRASPPFTWHLKGSGCAVHIASDDASVVDRFSFEQVRSVATDTIEECEVGGGKGWGYGGVAPIGRGLGWEVTVSGYKLEEGGGSGSLGVLE